MKPRKGDWYRHHERAEDFRILGIDEEEGIVEMQFASGDEADMDLAEWLEMGFKAVPAPEHKAARP